MIKAFAILLLSALSLGAAVNGTTPTALNLKSTFNCISVAAPFTGDEDRDNSAVVQFRASGATSWLNAYSPWVDRRVQIVTSDFTQSNPVSNQCRVSIVGLYAGTTYEVRIEWTDADGITGAAAITNTIATRSFVISVTGNELYVDASAVSEGTGTSGSPYKTITNALALCSEGDTIRVRTGTYVPFTWTKSGSASSLILLKANPGDSPVIQGGDFTRQILISANNIAIDGFTFAQTTNKAIEFSSGRSNAIVMNNTFNLYTNDGAIAVSTANGQNTNIVILSNYFTGTWPTTNDSFTTYGVHMGAQSDGFVIASNVFHFFRDAIGTGNGWTHGANNSDICYNTILNHYDDPCELEGDFVNTRYFGNTVLSTNSQTQLGLAGTYIGPVYIFRNTAGGVNTRGGTYGVKFYPTLCAGKIFMLHNVFDTIENTIGDAHEVLAGTGTNAVLRNNIFMARGNNIYAGESETDLDYNCYTNRASEFARDWDGLTTYNTFALFTDGTADEDHGMYEVPQLTASYAPIAGSPVVDAAESLDNFNLDSPTFTRSGPGADIGAFEYIYPAGVPRPSTVKGKGGRPIR
jgi:hypothetical protein